MRNETDGQTDRNTLDSDNPTTLQRVSHEVSFLHLLYSAMRKRRSWWSESMPCESLLVQSKARFPLVNARIAGGEEG